MTRMCKAFRKGENQNEKTIVRGVGCTVVVGSGETGICGGHFVVSGGGERGIG